MKPVEDLEMILSMAFNVDGTTCGRKEQSESIVGTSAWMIADLYNLFQFGGPVLIVTKVILFFTKITLTERITCLKVKRYNIVECLSQSPESAMKAERPMKTAAVMVLKQSVTTTVCSTIAACFQKM